MTSADISGLAFGAFTGAGYASTLFLGDCKDAGLELAASFFMIYEWIRNPGFTINETIIGPIPDVIQMILSFYYMFACVTQNNATLATELVFWAKYLQAAFAPYMYILTYLNGTRHDPFVASFALVKQIFNIIDATNYMNQQYHIFF